VPYPPDKGDRIRAFHVLRHLSTRATVHLACLADEPVTDEVQTALERHCGRVAVVPLSRLPRWLWMATSLARGRTATEGAFHSPALRAILRTWSREIRFDALLASSSGMVPYLRLDELRGVRTVVDLVDVDSQKWLDYAATSRPLSAWLYRAEGRRLRRQEQQLPTWCQAVTLVSEAEVDLYRRFCPTDLAYAISNGVDLGHFRPAPNEGEAGCVFTGVLDYWPNVEGLCWFCRDVWPGIHRRRPAARLALVGRNPGPAVRRLAEVPGVDVVGPVPDVRPYLTAAAVALAPLRLARGVQNKVLEAMAMGKAIVASPAALEGLSAEPGTHLVSASTAEEWIEAVLTLIDDPTHRQQVGSAARGYVEMYHRWERCLEPLDALLGLPPLAKGARVHGHPQVAIP
jgi:sugar transferase (PEP-CTERM/EpsH1 system associated)